MAFDPAREAAALEVQRRRRLSIEFVPGGGCRPVINSAGGRSHVGTGVYLDPVEAIEAAEALLTAGEKRDAEHRRGRLFDAMSRAVYAPWPQTPLNGPTRWLVLRVSDRQPMGPPQEGLVGALVEIARLVEEPAPAEMVP